MEPVQQLVEPFSKLRIDDSTNEAKQTAVAPHSVQNGSTRQARFTLLLESGIIDENGIANPSYMDKGLESSTNAAKVNIYNAVNLPISPKKDTTPIPQWKMEEILSIFQPLCEKYGGLFPFTFEQGTVYFKIKFSFNTLISFLKERIAIGEEIEMIGSGVVTMLGPDYYVNQINAWLDLPQVSPKQHAPINDYDFWVQTDALEKVEETVIDFLLYSLPFIGQVAPEDIRGFRYLIRELVCKNICSINGQKTIISFSNACGPDFDCTFSKSKMQPPFAFCNGLILGIPTDFNVYKMTAPYVAQGVNPAQCIADQYIGLLNGPTLHHPETRVNWILSKWTSGKWLFSAPWQDAIVQSSSKVSTIEALNRLLLKRRMGRVEECLALDENEKTDQLLRSLFTRFSDPIKGLYYLYLVSLYTLPLDKSSAAFSRNGSFVCLSLKIGTKTLYFSDPFNEPIAPLTQEELSIVQEWLTHFIQGGKFVADQALFTHLLKTNPPQDSLFGLSKACEEALFGKEYPCYEQFFDLQPWQAPLFAIARINAQYALRGQSGFALTESALQESATPLDLAWAFIQDAMGLAPFAVRKAIPTLLHISPELQLKWIEHALFSDKELASSLLRQSSGLSAEKKIAYLYRLLKEHGSPVFDEAVCTLTAQLQHETLFIEACTKEPKKVLDLLMWLVANNRPVLCTSLFGEVALLKILNRAVCAKKEKDKIPYYFLYRGAFAPDDSSLVEEDIKALALFPINTTIPCFTNVLEIALLQAPDKVPELLEKAASQESSSWTWVYQLKNLKSSFTVKDCCHVINACGRHFIANGDDVSLLFWVQTLLDCLKREKQKAAACLNTEIFMECVKQIKDPALYSHSELTKLLSNNELQQVYASFLKGLFERADKEAIAQYLKFFPKLALNSAEEHNVTQGFTTLLCQEVRDSETIRTTIFNLAKSVLISLGHTDLAKEGSDVLLDYPHLPFSSRVTKTMVTRHMKLENLKAWKDRFFEIAVTI
ncbi:MAG: hypothetical protein JSR46_02065, partial [Verrucomicrobia bacterium]|nr:hypothetical protein [Verrucomicrobiota bacterium]